VEKQAQKFSPKPSFN